MDFLGYKLYYIKAQVQNICKNTYKNVLKSMI